MTEHAPFPYIDIYNDPDWRAKAKVLVERVDLLDYKAVMQVVNLLEDGMIDPLDAERLREALQVYGYDREQEQLAVLHRDISAWFHRRPLSQDEYERQIWHQYGPAGKPPSDDAPDRVKQQHAAFVQRLAQLQEARNKEALLHYRPRQSDEGGDIN